jgi:hypothetical protein
MSFLGGPDIPSVLADLALIGGTVDVTLGGRTVTGVFDREAVEVLGDEMPGVVSDEEIVHIQTGVLPGLASGMSITVGGFPYVAQKALPYGDGAMTRIILRRP